MPRLKFRQTARTRLNPGNYAGPTYQETQTVDRPVRKPGFISDFIVPLAIAMAGSSLLTTFVVLAYGFIFDEPERGWLPLFGILFVLFAFIFYIISQAAAWSLLWAWAEIVTRKDLDKSGGIGDRPILFGNRGAHRQDGPRVEKVERNEEDEAEPERRPLEEIENWTTDLIVAYFPLGHDETMLQWFVRVADQIGTGSRTWETVLGRKRYIHFRSSLLEAGWAKWRTYTPKGKPVTTHGWELTHTAEEICENINKG